MVAAAHPVPATGVVEQPASITDEAVAIGAVEIDWVAPASGNLGLCGQQFWLGPQRAGRTLTLWIDITTMSVPGRDGANRESAPAKVAGC